MADIHATLSDDGRAIVALVLPYSHYVESSTCCGRQTLLKTIHTIMQMLSYTQTRRTCRCDRCCRTGPAPRDRCPSMPRRQRSSSSWSWWASPLRRGRKHRTCARATCGSRFTGWSMWWWCYPSDRYRRRRPRPWQKRPWGSNDIGTTGPIASNRVARNDRRRQATAKAAAGQRARPEASRPDSRPIAIVTARWYTTKMVPFFAHYYNVSTFMRIIEARNMIFKYKKRV